MAGSMMHGHHEEKLLPRMYRLTLSRWRLAKSIPKVPGIPGIVPGEQASIKRQGERKGHISQLLAEECYLPLPTIRCSTNHLRCEEDSSGGATMFNRQRATGACKHRRDTAHHGPHAAEDVGQNRRCPGRGNVGMHSMTRDKLTAATLSL